MGKERFTKQPEIVAAIISVIGTLVGTLLIGVFLGFMEGRLGLGPVVAVITLLLVLCIWGLLAFRWGVRVAGAAAAAMVIVGSVVFLIATAARFIPFGVPSATPVAAGASPTPQPMAIATTTPPLRTPPSSSADQVRAFAEPILAAIADRAPVFEDDFSDPGSGWPIGSTADGDEWGYEDDAYFISATYLPQGDIGASPDRAPSFSDFVLEVDARFVSGEWGFWNVIFRDSPGTLEEPVSAHYGVMFSPDGAFAMWKNVSGVHINLVEHSPHAPTFERGFETIHLTIIAQGPQIAVYVNGEPLWFVYDESSSRGMISVGVGNDTENTTLRVHFDNLKVWDISALVLPGETPAPLPSTPPSSSADQARAFAEPILAAIADRPLDFEDDFTTPDKGWRLGFPGGPPNGDRLEITDGVVRMTLFEGTEGMLTRLDWMWLKDFVLMVDSRQVSGGYGSPQMVVWGNPDDTWGQVAIQSGTASWNLSKGPGDQWPPWPKGSGDVVSPIGETNHILIVARGPQLAIYLNGVPVAYVEDQEIDVAWTKALSFNCGGQPDMVCEFDNVKLWNLDNVPGLP